MVAKAAANPAARSHTHVNDFIPLQVASTRQYMAIQYVDPSKAGGQLWNLLEWDVLESASNQSQRTLRQNRESKQYVTARRTHER
jgi:hypothetical protein